MGHLVGGWVSIDGSSSVNKELEAYANRLCCCFSFNADSPDTNCSSGKWRVVHTLSKQYIIPCISGGGECKLTLRVFISVRI